MKLLRLHFFVVVMVLAFSVPNVFAATGNLCDELGHHGNHYNFTFEQYPSLNFRECSNMKIPGTPDPIEWSYTCDIWGNCQHRELNVVLDSNVLIPYEPSKPGKKYPAVIFINSWGFDGYTEYIQAARKMARMGYITYIYTTRGTYGSTGHSNCVTDEDKNDARLMIDFLINHTPVDTNNIGIAAISYGAGIALITAGDDDRIKTVVAMSGWADFAREFLNEQTSSTVWLDFLVMQDRFAGGKITKNLVNTLKIVQDYHITKTEIDDIINNWSPPRSPLGKLPLGTNTVSKINARVKPISIMISKNYHDEMLKTNTSMDLYQKLTIPNKKLILNEGVHLTAEIWGAWGFPNYIFDEQVYPWFDYWLKNETSNNIMDPSKRVIMQIQGHELSLNPPREAFAQWPDPAVFENRNFYLTPRLSKSTGYLQDNTYTSNYTVADTIRNGIFDTFATSGGIGDGKNIIGMASSALAELFWPSAIRLSLADEVSVRDYGVVYTASTHAQSTIKIRGIPTLKLRVKPSNDRAQITAYLYDTDEDGKWGTLITHGVHTVRDSTNLPNSFTMSLNMAAWDVPPEHTLTLVLDTKDVLYVQSTASYRIGLLFDSLNQNVLTIPYVN